MLLSPKLLKAYHIIHHAELHNVQYRDDFPFIISYYIDIPW